MKTVARIAKKIVPALPSTRFQSTLFALKFVKDILMFERLEQLPYFNQIIPHNMTLRVRILKLINVLV